MKNKYLDINTAFNSNTFDKQELFETINNMLRSNKIPIDDLKANISYYEYEGSNNDWDEDEFQVNCTFSWIFYPEDVPKKDFKKMAEQIENIFKEQFNITRDYEANCQRYDDSEYTDHGYDVELELGITYKLEK